MRSRSLILPLGAFLAALSLPGQTPPAPKDLGDELDEIVNTDQIQAAGKRVQDASNAAADVVVIRSSELRAQGYLTLGDALGGVVGFRTNEDHAYQGLGVRGLYVLGDQNTRVLVLLDGHALNSPAEVGSSKVGEDFGLPMELVDRIEIVRGPASSLYGNNAFQALINVVSVDAAESRTSPFQCAISAGSGGRSELWANGGFRIGGITTSLVATGFQRTGSEQQYPELQGGALPAELDREERQSAYLRIKGETWSFAGLALSRTQLLASAPFNTLPGSNLNFYKNRRLSGEFKWEPRTDSIRWMFRLFGDRNEFQDGFALDPLRTPDGSGGNTYDADPDRSVGLEAQGRWQMHERVSLTFGTEQRLHRYSGLTWYEDGSSRIASRVDYRIGNTYLEGNWQVTSQLSLIGGLQMAEWKPSRIQSNVDGTQSDLEKESIRRLTPRLSVLFTPGSQDVLKLVLGQGFRFPTIFERYYTDGAGVLTNISLKPEVINSEQVVWQRKWTPRLRTQVSFNLFQWENQIFAMEATPGVNQYQNTPEAIHGQALEGECGWRFGSTELSGGGGWYKWTQNAGPEDNVAQWSGNLKATHHINDWSLAAEARYVDGRETLASTRVPAAWTLRASVRFDLKHGWLQLTGEDLTNSRRRDLVAGEYEPITWMAHDPRSIHATAGFKF